MFSFGGIATFSYIYIHNNGTLLLFLHTERCSEFNLFFVYCFPIFFWFFLYDTCTNSLIGHASTYLNNNSNYRTMKKRKKKRKNKRMKRFPTLLHTENYLLATRSADWRTASHGWARGLEMWPPNASEYQLPEKEEEEEDKGRKRDHIQLIDETRQLGLTKIQLQ